MKLAMTDDLCPRCGKPVGGVPAEGVFLDVGVGCICVCVHCSAFNVYQQDLTQREMTIAELAEIAASPRLAGFVETVARRAIEWRKAHVR